MGCISSKVGKVAQDTHWRRGSPSHAASVPAMRLCPEVLPSIIERAPTGILVVDASGRMVLANAQALRMFGYSRDELMGQAVEVLIPARFRTHHEQLRLSFMAAPTTRSMGAGRELFARRKDGSEFAVEIGLNPLPTPDGPVVLVAVADITERKRMETQFRALVEATPNGMVLVNASGLIVLVNAQAERMFGYSRLELLQQPVEVLLPAGNRARHVALRSSFLQAPAARSMGAGRELFARRKNGSEFPVEIGLNPIDAPEGTLVLAAVVDITERKHLEGQYRFLAESAPNGIVVINNDGTIKMVNAQTECMFGYGRGELPGQPLEVLVPDRVKRDHARLRQQFLEAPAVRPMGAGRDLFGRRKDGSEFPVEIGLYPMRAPDHGDGSVLASILDITERKRIEAQFRMAVEAAPSGMIIVDARGLVQLANAHAARMFGYDALELLHQPIELLVPARARGSHAGYRATFVAEPSTRAMGAGRDLFGCRKDGSEFPVEVGLNPVRAPDGALVVIASVVDISERRRLEERFRRVVEAAPSGLLMVNEAGCVVLLNSHVERLFGYTRSELLGRPVEMLLPERLRNTLHPWSVSCSPQVAAPSLPGARSELVGRRKDGSEFPMEVGLNPVRTREEGTMVLSTVADVSERLRQEEQQRALELAECDTRARGSLLATMSHEIRTPLTGIVGCMDLLAGSRDLNTPDSRDLLSTSQRCSDALLSIINDILDFSKLEAGAVVAEHIAFEPRRVVADVAAILSVALRDKGLTWTSTIQDSVPTTLIGDPGRLRQVLLNLGSNAAKFTCKGGVSLTVQYRSSPPLGSFRSSSSFSSGDSRSTPQPGETRTPLDQGSAAAAAGAILLAGNPARGARGGAQRLVFSMHDTGVGIPREVQARLFRPFAQADTSTTRLHGGTGLGLAISKHLAELMDGTITVTSEPGVGSKFVLEVGVQQASEASCAVPLEQPQPPPPAIAAASLSREPAIPPPAICGIAASLSREPAIPFRASAPTYRYHHIDGDCSSSEKVPLSACPSPPAVAGSTAGTALATAPKERPPQQGNHEDERPRLLLVDDDPVCRKVAVALLHRLGYGNVVAVGNGAEAVTALSVAGASSGSSGGSAFSLVFMDCEMPVMDGFAATAELRREGMALPIVAMTANAMVGDREQCLRCGMSDYVPKPVRMADLQQCLQRWLPQPMVSPLQ